MKSNITDSGDTDSSPNRSLPDIDRCLEQGSCNFKYGSFNDVITNTSRIKWDSGTSV